MAVEEEVGARLSGQASRSTEVSSVIAVPGKCGIGLAGEGDDADVEALDEGQKVEHFQGFSGVRKHDDRVAVGE